ncbi:hypothetical protein HZA99_01050 [Candidatus Woesearchaeota archaeon]|nr:hypothetical protein [Candidatus Woesearchaeota archaeon]
MNINEYILKTAFVNSWKSLGKQFVHVLFLDYLYYIILLLVGSFYWYRILPLFGAVLDSAKLLQSSQTFSSTQEFLTTVQGIGTQWSAFKWYSLGVFLVLFVNYLIFKYLVWMKIQRKQESFASFWKHLGFFALLNLIVILFYILVLAASWYMFVLETFNILFFFVVPLLLLFTMNVLHPAFMLQQNFVSSFSLFWNYGIKKFYLWIIPHLFMLAGAYFIMWFVSLFTFIPNIFYFFFYVLFFAAYFCWAKYYIYAVLKKIQQTRKLS